MQKIATAMGRAFGSLPRPIRWGLVGLAAVWTLSLFTGSKRPAPTPSPEKERAERREYEARQLCRGAVSDAAAARGFMKLERRPEVKNVGDDRVYVYYWRGGQLAEMVGSITAEASCEVDMETRTVRNVYVSEPNYPKR